ncbi:MAG: GNAT family protein [Rhizomicrobium sp.]
MPASTHLIPATDAHFTWMLGEGPVPSPDLVLPPDGVEEADVLRLLRRMTRRVHAGGSRGSWLMACEGEVVGLCSYKRAPKDGVIEIGYGVAASRRGRGHATRAVAAMLDFARSDPAVGTVTAATAVANLASQGVLERNGFRKSGTSHDPDDGDLILWNCDLAKVYPHP